MCKFIDVKIKKIILNLSKFTLLQGLIIGIMQCNIYSFQ